MDNNDEKKPFYLAYILMGAGSAWGQADNEYEALTQCKKQVEDEWSKYLSWDENDLFDIAVYDLSGVKDRWHVSYNRVVRDSETKEEVPFLHYISVKFKNKSKKRTKK